MKRILYQLIAVFILYMVFISCSGEAPRENPYDPVSSIYNSKGSLTGKLYDQTGALVSSAEIRSTSGSYITFSLDNGAFSINNIVKGTYTFAITKSGHNQLEYTVEINQNSTTEKTFYLGFKEIQGHFPFEGYSTDCTPSQIDITNVWSKIPGAEQYEINTWQKHGPSNRTFTSGTSNIVIPYNQWSTNYWKVRAVNNNTQGVWSDTIEFRVDGDGT